MLNRRINEIVQLTLEMKKRLINENNFETVTILINQNSKAKHYAGIGVDMDLVAMIDALLKTWLGFIVLSFDFHR